MKLLFSCPVFHTKRLQWRALVFAVSLVAFSCQETPKTEAQPSPVSALRDEVMDLHNAEMGKMGELKALKRQLNEMSSALDSVAETSKYQAIQAAIMAVDSGTFAMNSWMRNWKEPDTTQAVQEQIEAMRRQLSAMERTRDLMNQALQQATVLIPATTTP